MDYGYSPPIATRAGFLAIAILPFQVMFATKWNPITILTGVSHERLQVYHRWSGWIMCGSLLSDQALDADHVGRVRCPRLDPYIPILS